VAKETFIGALNDATLKLKVMEREPKTIEDALSMAIKFESFERSLIVSGQSDDFDDGRARSRPWKIYTVEGESVDDTTELHQQMTTLQDTMTKTMQRLDNLAADMRRDRAAQSSEAAAASPTHSRDSFVTTPKQPDRPWSTVAAPATRGQHS